MMRRRRPRRKKRPAEQKEPLLTPRLIRELFSWVLLTAGAVVVAVILMIAFGKRTEMSGDAMEPTIASGRYVLVDRLRYQLARPSEDDIIVFHGSGNRMRTYIRRVVAVSGDTVRIENGVLYVNGEERDNPDFDKMENAGIAAETVTLKNGEYFVLGDNRNNSEDSRSENIGVVRLDMIVGRAWHIGGE